MGMAGADLMHFNELGTSFVFAQYKTSGTGNMYGKRPPR
jgi:hypothetical protein